MIRVKLTPDITINYNPNLLQKAKDLIYNLLTRGEKKNCSKCIYMIDEIEVETCHDDGSYLVPATKEFACLCPKHYTKPVKHIDESDNVFKKYVIGKEGIVIEEEDPTIKYFEWIGCKSQRIDNFTRSIQDKTCGKRGIHFVRGTPLKHKERRNPNTEQDNRVYQPGGAP